MNMWYVNPTKQCMQPHMLHDYASRSIVNTCCRADLYWNNVKFTDDKKHLNKLIDYYARYGIKLNV